MAYCVKADLLVGDMPVSDAAATQFINIATDEIDSRLGVRYVMPLTGGADPHATLAVKRVCILLATGRLLMAHAVGGEDQQVNAYGLYLLREADSLLRGLELGEPPLVGVDVRPGLESTGTGPVVLQQDLVSPIDSFYGYATTGVITPYLPGSMA